MRYLIHLCRKTIAIVIPKIAVSKLISSKYLFFLLVIINSLPVLIFPFFQTLDGPAHLYNVNLLKEIIIEKNPQIIHFFAIREEWIPNWSSHLLLLLFRFLFSSLLANKLFLLLITIGLPLSVFSILRKLVPQNQNLAVIALPFIYTFLFGLGFYNFCLGVVIFMFTLSYWIGIREKISLMKVSGFFLMLMIAYFTHIFIFVLVFSAILGYSLSNALEKILYRSHNLKDLPIEFTVILLAGLPFVVLLVKYLTSRWGSSTVIKLPIKELLKWIVDVRPLIIYHYPQELKYTRWLFYLATGLFLYACVKYFFSTGTIRLKPMLQSKSTPFFLITIFFLVLYFILPNTPSSGASYISDRVLTFVYLTGFLGLFTMKYPQLIRNISYIIILVVNFGLLARYYDFQSGLNSTTKKFLEAAEYVENNSIVLPIRNSDDWMDLHFSNYLGMEKPLVILENYEATTSYFPLRWNLDELPSVQLGDTIITQFCLDNTFPASSKNNFKIDYILTWGNNDPDECKSNLLTLVESNYDLIYASEVPEINLFRSKEADTSYK